MFDTKVVRCIQNALKNGLIHSPTQYKKKKLRGASQFFGSCCERGEPLLLLMTVLTKTFFPFVRRNFMALPFLTAWHESVSYV